MRLIEFITSTNMSRCCLTFKQSHENIISGQNTEQQVDYDYSEVATGNPL